MYLRKFLWIIMWSEGREKKNYVFYMLGNMLVVLFYLICLRLYSYYE